MVSSCLSYSHPIKHSLNENVHITFGSTNATENTGAFERRIVWFQAIQSDAVWCKQNYFNCINHSVHQYVLKFAELILFMKIVILIFKIIKYICRIFKYKCKMQKCFIFHNCINANYFHIIYFNLRFVYFYLILLLPKRYILKTIFFSAVYSKSNNVYFTFHVNNNRYLVCIEKYVFVHSKVNVLIINNEVQAAVLINDQSNSESGRA